MIKINNKQYKLIEVYIFCVLLSFNITNLFVVPIGKRTMHIHHIVTFVFFMWTLLYFKRLYLKINMLVLFYFFSIFLSVIVAFKYGVGSTVVNVVYCLMLFSIVSAWSDEIDRERIYKIIQCVGYILAVAIALNLLVQWQKVFYSFEVKAAHLMITVLVAGGVNIEATFLATYACFMLYKKKYGFWIFSLLISILYSSRIAILLNILSLGLYIISYIKTKKSQNGLKKKHTIILLIVFTVIMGGMYYKGFFDHVIRRFLNIGKDAGSSERIQLWKSSLKVFMANPFGVGIGNAITYANRLIEEPIKLGNIHCVYLQVLVETGVVGFVLFLMSIYQIVKKAFEKWLSEPLSTMLLGYLFCCIFQFGGNEPLYILFWALFMLEESAMDDNIVN